MFTFGKKISLIIIILATLAGSFFYFTNRMIYSQGKAIEKKVFILEKGDNALEVGRKLKEEDLISNKFYFVVYLWKEKALHKLIADKYELNSQLTIPELSKILTGELAQNNTIKLTFPEGWTAAQMAERISANGLPGGEFLTLAKKSPKEMTANFDFLMDKKEGASLEGYLFPDTYLFAKDVTAQEIILKMLKNFDSKLNDQLRAEIKIQNKSIDEIVNMASIVQGEVRTITEMNMVSGIFWNRLTAEQRLQSDATLEYALGTNKKQHSLAETQIDSPYNTYRVTGLPPTPVNNPGIEAILASVYPTRSDYFYFLSDPKTGATVFAKTFEEHVKNKEKYGL